MALIIVMLLTMGMLLFSVIQGIFVGYPLLISLGLFAYLGFLKGFSIKQLYTMALTGAKKALIVLRIFVLIGAITGIWMASGTVPSIVYYGISYMNPNYFILFTFLICAVVSFLLGTSFGTVGTVGVALMLMAKTGHVSLSITAGAIMAGAYFGDRASPMSSSANLVAHLTETELYGNIKDMFKTAALPLIISLAVYGYLSGVSPFDSGSTSILPELSKYFQISWIPLLPALAVLLLALFRVPVRKSMVVSIGLAVLIAYGVQGNTPLQILHFMTLGFQLDQGGPLEKIIAGGGVISMWKAAVVVTTSSAMAGIFEGTNLLVQLETLILKGKGRLAQFLSTVAVSILTGSIGCNQSIAIILTEQLMRKSYARESIKKNQLAIDIENTGVVFAALIPWNIAAFVPTSTLGVDPYSYLPFAFYLYLIPIFQLISIVVRDKMNMSS